MGDEAGGGDGEGDGGGDGAIVKFLGSFSFCIEML